MALGFKVSEELPSFFCNTRASLFVAHTTLSLSLSRARAHYDDRQTNAPSSFKTLPLVFGRERVREKNV
jgi:hypothetical protein